MDAAYAGHRGSAATLLLLLVLTNFTMGLLVPNIYMRLRLPWSAASLLLQAMLLVSGSDVHRMGPACRLGCCLPTGPCLSCLPPIQLRASPGICRRVLLASGVAEPLSRLFQALDAAQ